MKRFTVFYKDTFGRLKEMDIIATDYEDAVLTFETEYPKMRAVIYKEME